MPGAARRRGRPLSPPWERARVRGYGDKRARGITAHLRHQPNPRFRQRPFQKHRQIHLTSTQHLYHNNNQAPPPTAIGTGAQKNRRVEGKRSFYARISTIE